jgi:prepilin-type N-terminal cleavage/methylation domain-containing protein
VKKVFTLVELIIVIVIIGILALIALPKMTQTYRIGNESAAQANLKVMSAAIENYAATTGNYPTAEANLTGANPPYLSQAHCGLSMQGYSYTCTFAANAYTLNANPVGCGTSGSQKFTIVTGGTLNANGC